MDPRNQPPPASRADKVWAVLGLLLVIGLFGLLLQFLGVIDEPEPAPRSYCEQSWDRYVANGRPNNVSRGAYITECQQVRDAVAKAR
jgi:hypothetical protein